MASNNLAVPIVLWGHVPPTHCISAILLTSDQRTVVTGCHDGQICLWDLNENMELVPRNMLFGHTAKITCLAKSTDTWEKCNVVSAAENGELCLWDVSDGRCIEHTKLSGTHTAIYPYQVGNSSSREYRLICHGYYAEILIMDANSLEVLFSLSSKLSPDWISCLCILRPIKRHEDVIVALSTSGTLKVWTLTGQETKPWRRKLQIGGAHEKRVKESEPIFETESKPLCCLNAKTLACCQFTQRTVLIVCSNYWQVYDAGDFSLLCSVPNKKGEPWTGGEFVAGDRVIVWSKAGRGSLYQLPSCCIPDSADFRSGVGQAAAKTPAPFQYLIMEIQPAKIRKPLACTPAMSFSFGRRGSYHKLLLRGDSHGRVTMWKIPDITEKELSRLKQEDIVDRPPDMPPHVSVSLQDVWDSMELKPAGIIDQLSTKQDNTPLAITASLYLPAQGRLVCGREDGSIIIVPATQTAKVQLLQCEHTKQRGWPPHRILRGHKGKVTCLVYPHQESLRYDPQYLVSGGVDFAVLLWDLFSGQLLHTFSVHGGEITQLVCPPDNCNLEDQYPTGTPVARVLQSVCSVASDHSVALLSLRERKALLLAGRHLFPVQVIKWRPADDFLVVGCLDNTVYVWQMETGHLDRVESGSVAQDILNACDETILPSESTTTLAQALKRRSLAAFKNVAQRAAFQVLQTSTASQSQAEVSKSQNFALSITPMRTNPKDSDFHVLFFDTEALIVQLLTDETLGLSSPITPEPSKQKDQSESPSSKRRTLFSSVGETIKAQVSETIKSQLKQGSDFIDLKMMSGSPKKEQTNGQKESVDLEYKSKRSKNLTLLEYNLTLDIAQLLMSCLHAWGLDLELDKLCLFKLGLLKPHIPVSFGLISRGGHMSLMLPTWYKYRERVTTGLAEPKTTQLVPSAAQVEPAGVPRVGSSLVHSGHWEISSAVTTQHLLSVISVANTLMGMTNASFLGEKINQGKRTRFVVDRSETGCELMSIVLESERVRRIKQVGVQGLIVGEVNTDSSDGTDSEAEGSMPPSIQQSQCPSCIHAWLQAYQHFQLSDDQEVKEAQIKQGWSLLAALHCVLLPDLLGKERFQPPQLQMLARRWQDRCLEVREAAQALMLAELQRIGPEGRKEVIDSWAPHLPNYVDPQTSQSPESQPTSASSPKDKTEPTAEPAKEEDTDHLQDEDLISGCAPSLMEDEVSQESSPVSRNCSPEMAYPTQKKASMPFEARRNQATAIVMLGVIGAEFGAEIASKGQNEEQKKKASRAPEGFSRDNYSLARHTKEKLMIKSTQKGVTSRKKDMSIAHKEGKALTYLLLAPPSGKLPAHTPIRRAAIDLIGRGFTVWEPYMDVSAVLLGLLELCCDAEKHAASMMSGLPLTPAADSCRTARHALSLIATARPSAFITTMAKEVARHAAMAANAQSQSAPIHTSVLVRGKPEILRVIELLIDKMQSDVAELIVEVMDITVHCLDAAQLKQKGLQETFPAICRFNMVSYDNHSRRIAVGARNGYLALYDQKTAKCQMIAAHGAPVMAVAFSPDGRHLATYSYQENKLLFWQMAAGLFGMMSGSSIKCIRSHDTRPARAGSNTSLNSLLKGVRLVWITQKNVIVLTGDGSEQKFSV
ncbi:WD repeat-containing protein 7-like isoform X4 [Branchiostoma floridae x Branchiostoma japonicum]